MNIIKRTRLFFEDRPLGTLWMGGVRAFRP